MLYKFNVFTNYIKSIKINYLLNHKYGKLSSYFNYYGRLQWRKNN